MTQTWRYLQHAGVCVMTLLFVFAACAVATTATRARQRIVPTRFAMLRWNCFTIRFRHCWTYILIRRDMRPRSDS
jgi:hypothetical protein